MKQYDYLIVGAGLYGAVFAHEAKKAGKKCLVIDKRSHIVGNIYTEPVEGHQCAPLRCPHLPHQQQDRVAVCEPVCGVNRYTNSPVATTMARSTNLPFNMNTFNKMWGVVTPAEARPGSSSRRRRQASPTRRIWKSRPSVWWAPTSTKSSSRATPASSGAAPAPSCRPLSSSVCRCVLPTTTTISTPCIRASPTAATPPWWKTCWRAPRCA